jgi:hypothetical protein
MEIIKIILWSVFVIAVIAALLTPYIYKGGEQ